MDSHTVTYIILAAAGDRSASRSSRLILGAGLDRVRAHWERLAAAVLSVFVLAAFVGTGIAGLVILLYYWDQILDFF